MKGFFLSKTTIFLVATLIILGTFTPAMLGAIDEAVRRNVFIKTEQIAGIVNVLQSSPSGTSHKFLLLKGDCELKITELSVTFTDGKQTVTREIAKNEASVSDSNIKCDKDIDREIYLKRCGNQILIDEKSREC